MDNSVELAESAPPFGSLFPSARYFEIDSNIAGERFSAWISLPAQYDADETQSFPVVYQVDGNLFFPATAPFHQAVPRDSLSPVIPFILVSVGYSDAQSQDWQWLRVRDLLPPGEAIPEAMLQAVEYAVQAGLLSKEKGDAYLTMFSTPAADKFLGFLEGELHPTLAAKFRIDEENVGLWGDSYGGLFAAYVAIKRSSLFKRIGAGSPGIIENSQIFKLYQQALDSKEDYSGRRLHVTIAARELTQQTIYQWLVARGTTELLAETALHPLPGLQVSTEIIPLETHLTAGVPAWFSFLRACYGRSVAAEA
ncbi:alpha/beta hydrolase [Sphingosinicella microcystinivorans]|uniref:alpha/beta hydrolase n=1 Tax=Sphingosinicella microcystinivorans TaxID=335406 RepID=UPI0022F404EA|nr:alpha/beta hydrolase-fold protein [Sphingosinicella microcystinivorans]WBX86219.1 alpha/beta hydrolase-fold protein [Sphingosinicella microcystinivorans]